MSLPTAEYTMYPVMEHFYTIQGEGAFSGCAAYFIRLGGCDVGCVWCDVKESWDASAHPLMDVDLLSNLVHQSGASICVITGGEPAMYNLEALTDAIHAKGIRVHIETSGAYPLTGQFDWICLSPKKFKPALPAVLLKAHELKVVIFHKSDFEWAESFTKDLGKGCRLFLQPEWSKRETMTPLIIDYVKAHTQWQISLQTHKFLNIP